MLTTFYGPYVSDGVAARRVVGNIGPCILWTSGDAGTSGHGSTGTLLRRSMVECWDSLGRIGGYFGEAVDSVWEGYDALDEGVIRELQKE